MKRNDVDKSRKLRRNQTDAEKKLWALLRNRQLEGVKFRRQFPLGGYIVDFYAPEYRLGIEADGGGHYENKGRQRDKFRTKELNELGVEIVRFSDRDILTNIEGVCERIKKVIEEKKNNPPHLHPLPKGRGDKEFFAKRSIKRSVTRESRRRRDLTSGPLDSLNPRTLFF
jgi:very-short-patch-repair endonuclease